MIYAFVCDSFYTQMSAFKLQEFRIKGFKVVSTPAGQSFLINVLSPDCLSFYIHPLTCSLAQLCTVYGSLNFDDYHKMARLIRLEIIKRSNNAHE